MIDIRDYNRDTYIHPMLVADSAKIHLWLISNGRTNITVDVLCV